MLQNDKIWTNCKAFIKLVEFSVQFKSIYQTKIEKCQLYKVNSVSNSFLCLLGKMEIGNQVKIFSNKIRQPKPKPKVKRIWLRPKD